MLSLYSTTRELLGTTMRIHVSHYDKKTTISIDDQLVDYLGAILVEDDPKSYRYGTRQRKRAVEKIKTQLVYDASYELLPFKNLSQYARKMVIKWIANPVIFKILDVRNPPEKKTRAKKGDVGKPFSEEAQKAFEELKSMRFGMASKQEK